MSLQSPQPVLTYISRLKSFKMGYLMLNVEKYRLRGKISLTMKQVGSDSKILTEHLNRRSRQYELSIINRSFMIRRLPKGDPRIDFRTRASRRILRPSPFRRFPPPSSLFLQETSLQQAGA